MKIRKKEKLVISICMILVVCFSLVTATYAWYAGTDPTILDGLNLSLDDKGDLKVEIALESGERMEMNLVDENGATIDMALSKLINIEENKLGPGAFGEVHIFISSRSATYTGYTIKISPNYDLIEDGDEEALTLAKEHICFYAAKTENGYEQLIPYNELISIQNELEDSENPDENIDETVDEAVDEALDGENEPTSKEEEDASDTQEKKEEESTHENVVAVAISVEEGSDVLDNTLENSSNEVTENSVEDNSVENNSVEFTANALEDAVDDTVENEEEEEEKEPEPLIKTLATPVVTADGITGTLASGEETEIILYWYWPYEYDDVPDKTQISAQNEREYDLQDTVIGNYIQSIGFTFVVEGNTDEE